MKTGSRNPASGFLSRVSHLVQVPLTAIRTSGTSPAVVYPLIFFRPPLFSCPVKNNGFTRTKWMETLRFVDILFIFRELFLSGRQRDTPGIVSPGGAYVSSNMQPKTLKR